jgi:hypothetical protein
LIELMHAMMRCTPRSSRLTTVSPQRLEQKSEAKQMGAPLAQTMSIGSLTRKRCKTDTAHENSSVAPTTLDASELENNSHAYNRKVRSMPKKASRLLSQPNAILATARQLRMAT